MRVTTTGGRSRRGQTTPEEKAQECARVTQRQRAQQAKGRCRSCGDWIAPGSTSRCLASWSSVDETNANGAASRPPGSGIADGRRSARWVSASARLRGRRRGGSDVGCGRRTGCRSRRCRARHGRRSAGSNERSAKAASRPPCHRPLPSPSRPCHADWGRLRTDRCSSSATSTCRATETDHERTGSASSALRRRRLHPLRMTIRDGSSTASVPLIRRGPDARTRATSPYRAACVDRPVRPNKRDAIHRGRALQRVPHVG